MAFDAWLDDATPSDLAALAQGLLDGKIADMLAAGSIQRAGFHEGAVALLAGLSETDPKVVAWMLKRLADERRRADDRYAAVARLVWSGPGEAPQALRDTRVVLDGLFSRAERHVLISTFVIYNGRDVFAALTKRLEERPDLRVDIYVNLQSKTGLDEDERADVAEYLDLFARDHWPRGLALPALYYDPEARKQGAKRATLHAKCVVVDGRWAFVTSANFTEAAQKRNIEAGVLLDHPKLAETLAGRFEALRDKGKLRRMGG